MGIYFIRRAVLLAVVPVVFLSGCVGPGEWVRETAGVSILDIEDYREDASSRVFESDYATCYKKTEELLKAMPYVSVYAKTEDMIALYEKSVDTTPVGIFFTAIDNTHTKIEIASPSTPAREWIAKSVFSGKHQTPAPPPDYF